MICSQCNKEFTHSHGQKKYCSIQCIKEHTREYNTKYRKSNKRKEYLNAYYKSEKYKKVRKNQQSDEFKESQKKYLQSDKFKESQKKYLQSDKFKTTLKKYQKSDKGREAIKAAVKKYTQSDKGLSSNRRYSKERRKSDPIYKLTMNMRNRLNGFLKSTNIKKTNKTFQEVGCTPEFLKKHLEKQFHPHPKTNEKMTWKNHTVKGWHVDHVIPLDSAKSREDLERLGVAHYTNLQPMWAKENIRKSNKIV